MIRVLVVDDHIPTRQEVVQHLAGDVIEVVGEAGTSNEAMQMARELLPDIVLLDLHLPGLIAGDELVRRMVALRNVHVVMFASQGKPSDVQDYLDLGASGYILKSDAAALIRMALLMVHRGSTSVLSPSLPRHITKLTAEERNVLRAITMRGTFNKAAQRLEITEEYFGELLEGLLEKVELETPEQLLKWAKKHGFQA